MFKLFQILMAGDSHIRKCLHYLQFALAFFIISSIISNNITAQKKSHDNKKSKRDYYYNFEKSSSSKSSAVNVEFPKDKRPPKDYHNYDSDNSENYFRIDKSRNSLWDGKHWGESRLPLNIYIKESPSRYFKSIYKDYVKYAMDVWRKADDRIQYKFVNSVDDADIAIIFEENLGDIYEENYLGLTEYDSNKNKEIEFSKIQISLIKNGNEIVSTGEIKATIIHELGHAFGLGHSKNRIDLMHPYISPRHKPDMNYDELSKGDKLAIKDVINLCFEEEYVWK